MYKWFILAPSLIVLEMLCLSGIFTLLTLPYDGAVIAGVFATSLFVFLNYILIKQLTK